jgi:large subunit ribosomal protein L10
MNRSSKEAVVESVRSNLDSAASVVLTKQTGLTVAQVTALRSTLRQAGVEMKVVKNTLAMLAMKGTDKEGLTDYLTGPTAIVYSAHDPVAPAKILEEFASKNEKLQLVAGYLNGQILDQASVKALAKLPSLNELRGTLIGLINAPATKIARLSKEPGSMLARVLSAKSQQG